MTDNTIECALATADRTFGPLQRWSHDLTPVHGAYARSFRLADIDGDGLADACARSAVGIICTTSSGRGFNHAHVWLATSRGPREAKGKELLDDGRRLELADLNGDGRADLCGRAHDGIDCAISNGHTFTAPSQWSKDFGGDGVRLADLNGDGRADACASTPSGISCALSGGHAFKHATIWSPPNAAEIQLADLNGDGRADLCAVGSGAMATKLECGMAP